MISDRPKIELEPDPNHPLFFQEGIQSAHLAGAYEKLFGFVQATRPKAFDGYVSTRTGYWYQVCFGWMRQRSDGQGRKIEAYRGYVQVDPHDVPDVIEILSQIAKLRLDKNQRTEFKVLLGTNPQTSRPYGPNERFSDDDLKKIGIYNNLTPEDAELVVYGESQEEIIEILTVLASDPRYAGIEGGLRRALRFVQKPFFSRGDTMHSDGANTYLTLSYNNRRGYHED